VSFRLRIFLLVMLVAVTAIGATAFLTLSLTSREVTRSQEAARRHAQEIIDEIGGYGRAQGRWELLSQVAVGLSERTELHIQLTTTDDVTIVDTDNLRFGQASGPVQAVPFQVDPRPELTDTPGVVAAERLRQRLATDAAPPAGSVLLEKISAGDPVLPENLYAAEPTDPVGGSMPAQALRQLSQYRAGLIAVRCVADKTEGTLPALPLTTAPYLTPALIAANQDCVRKATAKVLGDTVWLEDSWRRFTACDRIAAFKKDDGNACVRDAFHEQSTTTAAPQLQLYLGAPSDSNLGQLGRPAALGAAGLILVALVGTALIARQVSNPVRRLTEASRRLAAGRLDARVRPAGNDELARLAESFNAMADAVQGSEERQRRLVADVAHELRTPLSNLRGYLEGLSDGVVEPSRELFASLHEETLLQRRILDDLQVLALAEAGNLGYQKLPVDLADLVGVGATLHRAVAAEAGIALTVDVPAPVWVEADPDRLRQVLGNLLTNAIRYTDAGGHVLVRVREEAGQAVLIVQDTGVGMSPPDLARVFDRFWRADPARQRATGGTGLGLTIAHRIVTDHHGRIEVTSRPGEGTTFTVRLPLSGARRP
jgi:two-component system, OmpR family, sensor histidine kinase BaeS